MDLALLAAPLYLFSVVIPRGLLRITLDFVPEHRLEEIGLITLLIGVQAPCLIGVLVTLRVLFQAPLNVTPAKLGFVLAVMLLALALSATQFALSGS